MIQDREFMSGVLAKDASFRLIVRGNIGAKEIERLIEKLEIDRQILAEQDDDEQPSLSDVRGILGSAP